ncbi:MAG: hypothetical protein AB1465_00905 [Patescibacteria group bacterium]
MNRIEKEYLIRLKKIGPQRRLKIALDLENLVLDIAREGIKNQYKTNDKKTVNKELKKRIQLAEKLENLWIKKRPLLKP